MEVRPSRCKDHCVQFYDEKWEQITPFREAHMEGVYVGIKKGRRCIERGEGNGGEHERGGANALV